MYMVHLDAPNPLDAGQPIVPPPKPIPPSAQKEVVFIEVYADAQAFADHLNGPTFKTFLAENIRYFEESKGWPVSDTTYLDRQSAFIRPAAGDDEATE